MFFFEYSLSWSGAAKLGDGATDFDDFLDIDSRFQAFFH
jgi:hypothetical protein